MMEWMGRYRQLVLAIVQHTNVISRYGGRHFIAEGISLSSNEWQVMEYIVEHREDDENMIFVSETLGIPQSSFSKLVKNLSAMGLIERYRSIDNKKNVILRPTDLALRAYDHHQKVIHEEVFKPFFDALEGVSDEDLNAVTEAISLLSANIAASHREEPEHNEKSRLIRID